MKRRVQRKKVLLLMVCYTSFITICSSPPIMLCVCVLGMDERGEREGTEKEI